MDTKLNCEFTVKNTDSKAWDFQAALHTYFHVNDIDKCEVRGNFKGKPHLNRMAKPPATTPETRDAIRFTSEVDSCYEGVSGKVVFVDEVKPEQSVTIANLKGWEDTVLWSPYGNEGMGYKNFACVESVKVRFFPSFFSFPLTSSYFNIKCHMRSVNSLCCSGATEKKEKN
jgi:glucose-6-phosphate 1-epimerase